jgi:hypothetical protein
MNMGSGFGQAGRTVRLCGILWLASVAGCVMSGPPSPPPTIPVTVGVPTITALDETKESQTKGGLVISIAPVEYAADAADVRTVRQIQPPLGATFLEGDEPQVYVQTVVETKARVKPPRLEFLVTVNNQMPRVFHGAGTVVQFDVGGKLLAVDQRGYSDLQNAIVPPRTEQQIRIYGPRLDRVPSTGTLGVFLYDVVTNQNDAGVVTEKQNFEWYFTLKTVNQTVQGRDTFSQGWMPIPAYRAELARERREAAMERFEVSHPGATPEPDVPPPGE